MWREPWFWIIVAIVLVLLFGAPRLPALAKSLGQSMRIFRGEVKNLKEDGKTDEPGQDSDKGDTTPSA